MDAVTLKRGGQFTLDNSLKTVIKKYTDVQNWDHGYNILCRFLDSVKVDKSQKSKMCIVCDEIYSNISRYAYKGKKGKIEMDFEFDPVNLKFTVTFIDSGVEYDPTKRKMPDVTRPLTEREPGGLGLFIVNNIMDHIKYERKSNKNYLRLEKKVNIT